MSEYQYYNFQAIDRQLSAAEITPVSFVNEYNWGDLKANPRDLMEKFFDVHVYLANWGSAVLMLRLPKEALDEQTLKVFAIDGYFEAEPLAEHWLLTWSLGDWVEYLEVEDEVSGWMAQLKVEAEVKRKREVALSLLARDFAGVWKRVQEEACRSCASAYDIVCRQLVDLRDAYDLQGNSATFRQELQRFMLEHGRRKALLTRIDKAGLGQEAM